MKKLLTALLGFALLAAPATPALAGWKLIEKGETVKVAKSNMHVTPAQDWNRWTHRPVKKGEVWTLDGINLNELYFVGGLLAEQTLFRDVRKKEQPLPKLSSSLELVEIPEFVESSTRIALSTSVFETTSVEPTTLGGKPAVRFTYEYAVDSSPLKRKGLGVGTMVDGELYLIIYTAPELYFFDRDVAAVEALIESATL